MAAVNGGNITFSSMNKNDVLCGRGIGQVQYVGNRQMRRLVRTRREEYVATPSYKAKKIIAEELFAVIKNRGGRFLRLVETGETVKNIVKEGEWEEETEKKALEKIKQSLREKREDLESSDEEDIASINVHVETAEHEQEQRRLEPSDEDDIEAIETAEQAQALEEQRTSIPVAADLVDGVDELNEFAPETVASLPNVLSPMLFGSAGSPITSDSRLLLYQATDPFAVQQGMDSAGYSSPIGSFREDAYSDDIVSSFPQVYREDTHSWADSPAAVAQPESVTSLADDLLRSPLIDLIPVSADDSSQPSSTDDTECMDMEPMKESTQSTNGAPLSHPNDDLVSEALLALMGLSLDEPQFTEEELQREQATLTEEEKESVLSDTLGKMHMTNRHQNKRPRRDLDLNSVSFHLEQMRLEIEKIPMEKKQALMEAQMKCRPEEFSDERLKSFLSCEGMNAKVRKRVTLALFTSEQKDACLIPAVHSRTAGSRAFCRVLGGS